MAIIHKSALKLNQDSMIETAEESIRAYWGAYTEDEKYFAIPFWQLEKMFLSSWNSEVVLSVYNIDNKQLIDGHWSRIEDIQEESPHTNLHYFIFNSSEFEPIRLGVSLHLSKSAIIVARIGVTDEGVFTCFIMFNEFNPIDTGGGGNGAGLGLKIPAGSGD